MLVDNGQLNSLTTLVDRKHRCTQERLDLKRLDLIIVDVRMLSFGNAIRNARKRLCGLALANGLNRVKLESKHPRGQSARLLLRNDDRPYHARANSHPGHRNPGVGNPETAVVMIKNQSNAQTKGVAANAISINYSSSLDSPLLDASRVNSQAMKAMLPAAINARMTAA